MFVNPHQEKIGLSENDEFWARRLWWPNTKKDFIYQKDIDTPGEMLYKNCLWIGRRKIDQKKLKPLVSNTQTIALNSISLAISNECDLLN